MVAVSITLSRAVVIMQPNLIVMEFCPCLKFVWNFNTYVPFIILFHHHSLPEATLKLIIFFDSLFYIVIKLLLLDLDTCSLADLISLNLKYVGDGSFSN